MNESRYQIVSNVPVKSIEKEPLKMLILKLMQEAKITDSADPKLESIITEIFRGMSTDTVAYYYSALLLDQYEEPSAHPRHALFRFMHRWAKNFMEGIIE